MAAGILLLSFNASALDCSEYEAYEALFKEYTALVEPLALDKDVEEIERISDQFVDKHREYKIAEIYIWNKELNTKNHLLFMKTFIKSRWTIAYPKVNFRCSQADPVLVQKLESNGQEYVIISQDMDKLEYRMVIFLP